MTMNCPSCGKKADYIDSKEIYNGISYGWMYICWPCMAWVGTHRATGKALGLMANKELRDLRKKAHALFDPLWMSGKMRRQEAYDFLKKNTGVPHISWTKVESCKKVIKFLEGLKDAEKL